MTEWTSTWSYNSLDVHYLDGQDQSAIFWSLLVLDEAWSHPDAMAQLCVALVQGSRQLNQQFLALLTTCLKVRTAEAEPLS